MKKHFLSLLLLFVPWLSLAGTEEPTLQERSQEEISEAVHWTLNLMNGRMGDESYIDIQKADASRHSLFLCACENPRLAQEFRS